MKKESLTGKKLIMLIIGVIVIGVLIGTISVSAQENNFWSNILKFFGFEKSAPESQTANSELKGELATTSGSACGPRECFYNTDCGTGRECGQDGCCHELTYCSSDIDCPAGKHCTNYGASGAGVCTYSSACQAQSYDLVSGGCYPCKDDDDCHFGSSCSSGKCVCSNSDECGSFRGSIVQCHNGNCVPCQNSGTCSHTCASSLYSCLPCRDDGDCWGRVCISGNCVQTCSSSFPCPTGYHCVSNHCEPTPVNTPCSSGEGTLCSDGGICHSGYCINCFVNKNTGTSDCPSTSTNPLYCINGICKSTPECTGTLCTNGNLCKNGVCVPCLLNNALDGSSNCPSNKPYCVDGICQTNQECYMDSMCTAKNKICKNNVCVFECLYDGSCSATGKVCKNNKCVVPPCTTQTDCCSSGTRCDYKCNSNGECAKCNCPSNLNCVQKIDLQGKTLFRCQ